MKESLIGLYWGFHNFLLEDMNTIPMFAALHSCAIGMVLGLAGYTLASGGSFEPLPVALALLVLAFSVRGIFSEHRDWRRTIGNLDGHYRRAFHWGVWPTLPVGALGFGTTLAASDLLTDALSDQRIIIAVLASALLAFSGWMGTMNCRRVLHGG